MITKKEFIEIIDRLKQTNDFVEETNDNARRLQDAIRSENVNAMSLSISHEEIVVQLLENIFKDEDIIGWWLYELDYGRKYEDGFIKDEDSNNIDLSTPEKLYDFLIDNMEDR